MAPTFRQLRYFTVLAEELHFGRAARRLNISQPPLSTGVRQLEEDLGVKLLERSSRRVALTRAGEAFAARAVMLLGQLAEAEALTRRIATSPGGVVRVGLVPSMIYRGLPEMLHDFAERHAGFTVEIREMNSAAQIAAVFESKIDIGFIHGLPLPAGMESLLIMDEPFVCCLPASHPLARSRRVPLASLALEPLIIFARPLAPHYHDHIVSLLRGAGFEPRIVHEVGHWLTVVALVAHELGVALVPRALSHAGIAGTVFLPLDHPTALHEARAIWSPAEANAGRDRLIDCVRDVVARTRPARHDEPARPASSGPRRTRPAR
ncbi:LysR family transcriptional regulator [Phreatobacter sp. AB_2022a]|uniref:LysR family transcriptional regulator n=1 Tax=Phreatobacter sp. AB_2022a TaxID=3003134 RepID=UPI0022871096|nr:LysR family transcriptional regulator [Phreatobacter sp. AB_2022a]MCZ0736925.1 LysR family transcriptional regulator [Phreatobacter sp. AB_2022a]